VARGDALLAPSAELREWFGHEPNRFAEFRRRYIGELRGDRSRLTELRRRARAGALTLVYSAHDSEHNDAVVLADGRHPVLLKAIDPGRGRVTFDLIQYFHGDQATIEAAKDHQESPPPNDSYSRNVNPKLRTLPVRADATITANQLAGSNQSIPVSLTRLASLTRASSGMFWITVRGDQVVQIGEQWLP
jgi:hypothetical protein